MKTEQCYKTRGKKYNAQDAAINAVEKKYKEITGDNKRQNKIMLKGR